MPDSETTGSSPVSLPKGRAVIPNIRGILAPVISASRIPTFLPWRLRAMANSAVTSDFPTPPLPLITATILSIWFNSSGLAATNSVWISLFLNCRRAALTPAATKFWTSAAKAVEASVTVILPSAIVILRTKLRSMTLCSTAGTKTCWSAVFTCSSVIIYFPFLNIIWRFFVIKVYFTSKDSVKYLRLRPTVFVL